MTPDHRLPEPDAEALALSEQLRGLIAHEIDHAGGAIPFSRYMELALYAPGLGYYSAGATKFGAAGDFITAPELGSLFADGVAQAVSSVLHELGPAAVFVELGGGSGAFAFDALQRLDQLDALPARYLILEPSAQLKKRQQQHIANLPNQLSSRVEWIDRPPQHNFDGVIFANEVLDALPTTRFWIHDEDIFEEGVSHRDGKLQLVRMPTDLLVAQAVRRLEQNLTTPFPDGYRSELLPQLPYWLQAVCGGLQRGLALFVDYGYPRREFYLPERHDGTLVCHYRHRAHSDALYLPGLQDITAFVDFTALAEAGQHAGQELAGYCNQAQFLLGNGLPQRVESLLADATDEATRYNLIQQMKRLTLPGDMGERFQVMGLSRNHDAEALFAMGDLRHRL